MDEWDVSVMLLDSVSHRSSSPTAFTENPVNHVTLFSRVNVFTPVKTTVDLNSVAASTLEFGFQVLVIFWNMKKWQMFFLLGDNRGFCNETFGVLVKTLNNPVRFNDCECFFLFFFLFKSKFITNAIQQCYNRYTLYT